MERLRAAGDDQACHEDVKPPWRFADFDSAERVEPKPEA
jgi:hypothetical protein